MKMYLFLIVVFISGCRGHHIVKPQLSESIQSSELATIVIVKDAGPRMGEGGFYFGENKKTYAVVKKAGLTEMQFSPGSHTFEVWATGSPEFAITVELAPGSKTCINVHPNNANYYGKAFIPILRNAVHAFEANVVPCNG